MSLTVEERTELARAKHAKAIRVAIFQVGFAIVALFAADRAFELWPQHVKSLPFVIATILGISMAIHAFHDSKSIEFIEKRMNEDKGKRDHQSRAGRYLKSRSEVASRSRHSSPSNKKDPKVVKGASQV